MHELSIAQSLMKLVEQQVPGDELGQVRVLKLRIGALSCVNPDSLRFSFGLVAEDTPLKSVRLEIEMVPVNVYCSNCSSIETLPGIQCFRCPQCQQPSSDIRSGLELDLESIEMLTT